MSRPTFNSGNRSSSFAREVLCHGAGRLIGSAARRSDFVGDDSRRGLVRVDIDLHALLGEVVVLVAPHEIALERLRNGSALVISKAAGE